MGKISLHDTFTDGLEKLFFLTFFVLELTDPWAGHDKINSLYFLDNQTSKSSRVWS